MAVRSPKPWRRRLGPPRYGAALRYQATEQLRIDIAAGQDCRGDLALYVDLSRQQRGQSHRPSWLDHELELAECKGNCRADFLVAHRRPFSDKGAIDGEGQLTGRLRHQRIADRAGERGIRLAVAAAEGASV